MRRLAWFSPMPPARSGIAVNSAEVVSALRDEFEIDVYVDEPIARAAQQNVGAQPLRSAHDFVWRHQLNRYDLIVYQLGNSSAHDFLWPYLFRYPGLAVLHDAQLHHARAAALLRQRRPDNYRREFAAAHPEASRDLAELAVKGFDSYLYYTWPMTRLVVQASRVTGVHAAMMRERLLDEVPGARVESLALGHGERLSEARAASARAEIRRRHDIQEDAVVFGVFGGLTPEKRVPQVLEAFAATLPYAPGARLLLVGEPAAHYDLASDIARHRLERAVTVTGYVDDAAFTDHIAASDVSLNLRWPTAREMSGPWLRAIAAARPTVTLDLWHTSHVPALDPRTWSVVHASPAMESVPEPVMVALDVLDELHSLGLAMRRLAVDADLRMRLSRTAATYWEREHSHERMLADYRRVIDIALVTPDPVPDLPAHLRTPGDEKLRALLDRFGITPPIGSGA